MARLILTELLVCLSVMLVPTSLYAQNLDAMPSYVPMKLTEGTLTSVGSDTMDELLVAWVEAYREYQPAVTVNVTSQGSAAASAALLEGFADLGPMVRPMKSVELTKFQKTYGFRPTQVRTALSALAVYVSDKNPIGSISFQNLDAIYSTNRLRGGATPILTWKDLGIKTSKLGEALLVPLIRESDSFPNELFRQSVLAQSDYRTEVIPCSGEKALFDTILANDAAIGVGALFHHIPAGVKILPVSKDLSQKPSMPTLDTLLTGEYPLSRFLSVYIVRFPGKEVETETKDFLSFVLSKEGQSIVSKLGFVPLSAQLIAEERAKLYSNSKPN